MYINAEICNIFIRGPELETRDPFDGGRDVRESSPVRARRLVNNVATATRSGVGGARAREIQSSTAEDEILLLFGSSPR